MGFSLLNIASRAPQIRSPSNLAKGRSRATEPVATMTLSAVSVWMVLPGVAGAEVSSSLTAHSCTSTVTLFPLAGVAALVILALPTTWVILFFLKRKPIPLLSLLATSRERPMMRSQSRPTLPSILRPQKA